VAAGLHSHNHHHTPLIHRFLCYSCCTIDLCIADSVSSDSSSAWLEGGAELAIKWALEAKSVKVAAQSKWIRDQWIRALLGICHARLKQLSVIFDHDEILSLLLAIYLQIFRKSLSQYCS
jgi:hypothetical protein